MLNLDGETFGGDHLENKKTRWACVVGIDLMEMCWEDRSGWNWLRIMFSGGLLR